MRVIIHVIKFIQTKTIPGVISLRKRLKSSGRICDNRTDAQLATESGVYHSAVGMWKKLHLQIKDIHTNCSLNHLPAEVTDKSCFFSAHGGTKLVKRYANCRYKPRYLSICNSLQRKVVSG